ncbi:MAG: integration host factor subunit alpha [Syntrophales bacterium]|jgi:integration host factor subunit alpha
MALTKIDLVDMIYNELDMPKKKCIDLVDSFFDIIKDELALGNDVMVSGFGKWSVKQKGPRIGRSPQTGEKITIDARRVVTFKSAPPLRSIVNGGLRSSKGG